MFDINELIAHSMGLKIPRRQMQLNNAVKLSLPFIKLDALRSLPRIIKTQGIKNIFKTIKETLAYIRRKKKKGGKMDGLV